MQTQTWTCFEIRNAGSLDDCRHRNWHQRLGKLQPEKMFSPGRLSGSRVMRCDDRQVGRQFGLTCATMQTQVDLGCRIHVISRSTWLLGCRIHVKLRGKRALACFIHDYNMPQSCSNHSQNVFKSCPSHPQIIPKSCPYLANVMPRPCLNHA